MIKIGFSEINLEGSLLPKGQAIREPIEATTMYIEGEVYSSIWIVFDLMDLNRLYTDSIKKSISERTLIEVEHIHVLSTHNHGGGEPDIEALSSLAADCAISAKANKRDALMRYSFTKTDKQVNILRRIYIPEIKGSATLYFGAYEGNSFNSSLFAERVLSELSEGKECNYIGDHTERECVPFAEADKEISCVQFCDSSGEIIGTIVRFSSHAVTANRGGSFSSDYPYYVRQGIKKEFGGCAMFLNGPCAEIAPVMRDKFEGRERILGDYLSTLAKKSLESLPFEAISTFSDEKFEVMLPVREEVINNKVDIPEKMPKSLSERKKYIDLLRLNNTLDFLSKKYREGETEVSDEISVYLGGLRFNDIYFVGFPGETFYATGEGFKRAFEGKKIITVTEHERTVMYLPPKEEFLRGGYEACCKLTSPDSEQILLDKAIASFKDFIE